MPAPANRHRRRATFAALALLALLTTAASAGEFGADAEVLEREAVYRTVTLAQQCRYPSAPQGASLGALLRWDLGREQPVCDGPSYRRELEGYRVTYRWNGRQFTDFMPADPGASLRVRVHVD